MRINQLYLSLVGALLIFTESSAQQAIRISTPDRLQDDKINKSLAILPVYKFESREIEPYTMFGVEPKEDQKNLVVRAMPDMTGMQDTGYTYLYFSGANSEINQGYLLTMIGNYRRSRRTIFFFIDRNNNLDFTDDGEPDSLTIQEHSKKFILENLNNPEATHQVRITRIEYGENIRYKNLLTDHFKKHSGNKNFTDINYCYREQRLNTVGGTYRSGSDSFVLALKDMNNNGIFNESCMDMLYVGSVNETVNTDEMNYIHPDVSTIYFEWNRKRYRVKNIDPAGKFIDVELQPNAELSKKLEVGKKVDNFSFVNIRNQKEELKEYRKKPVYIYFWNSEQITKKDTMFIRLIYEEFSDKIQLITLNHGDVPRTVRIIQYYDRVKWPIAFSSYQIGSTFYLEDIPRGYYLGKKCVLKDDRISPEEMYNKLKEDSNLK